MNVTFVNSSNWEGMYIDGQLSLEGYSLEPILVAKAILKHFDEKMPEIESIQLDEDWVINKGVLPDDVRYIKPVNV